MKKLLTLSILLLFGISCICQERNPERNPDRRLEEMIPVQYNIVSIPNGKTIDVYFFYKIPYSSLIFSLKNNSYTANYSIAIEVFKPNGQFAKREIKDNTLITSKSDETSLQDLYSENYIKLTLDSGTYKVFPIFNDHDNDKDLKLKSAEIKVDKNGLLNPVAVYQENKDYVLASADGNIPFEEKGYDLIFPVEDTSVASINATIITSTDDTVFTGSITKNFISHQEFELKNNKIILSQSSNGMLYKNFVLSSITNKFNDGKTKIEIKTNKNQKASFIKNVKWYNGPMVYDNPKFAIMALSVIEKEDSVSKLLDNKDELLHKVLYNYWKNYDPDKSTKYNPVMAEYYRRVDYAITNYSSLDQKNETISDRGKAYITFGRPNDVQRYSDNDGKMVEVWIYNSPSRKLYFVDYKGTGNYTLQK